MSAASRIPLSSLRRALMEGVSLRGRSESSACRFRVSKLVPYLAIAPHGGHRVRRDVARTLTIDERARERKEALGTDRLVTAAPIYVVSADSRFDYDLELSEEAQRLAPGQPAEIAAESLARHREVVGVLEALVKAIIERFGACLVFEVDAFDAPSAPAASCERPTL